MSRSVYLAAAIVLALCFVLLGRANRAVEIRRAVLETGAPARIYTPDPPATRAEPAPTGDHPALVVAHGWGANHAIMSGLARAAVRAGWVVVTFDFRGHGENARPVDETAMLIGRPDLVDDVRAAVELARTHPRVDPQGVVLVGHSMGASAVMGYAARDPSVAGTIAISSGYLTTGPYPPPNVLLLFAESDAAGRREVLREIGAKLAGRERVVLDRTYGEPARATGLRVSEIPGTNHLTITQSRRAFSEVLAWAALSVGRSAGPGPIASDGRGLASGIGLLALAVLLFAAPQAIARLVSVPLPRESTPPATAFGLSALVLVAAAAALVGIDFRGSRGPFAFFPIQGARDLLGILVPAGSVLALLAARRGALVADGLGRVWTWLGAGLLFGATYLGLGALLAPFHELWLSPARLPWFAVSVLGTLPLFAALEGLHDRRTPLGIAASALSRVALVVLILVGAALGWLPYVLLLGAAPLAIVLLLLELYAIRLRRVVPNPWLAALYQSAVVAWIPAACFPFSA